MPVSNGFQLVAGDVALIRSVHEVRLATIDHLAALTGRSYKRTQERLAKLEARRYLKLIARRPEKHVYALGNEAVPLLIEHGYAAAELANRRLREHELKPLGIRHAVFVADIHVRLIRLTRERSCELARWMEGSALWDRVTTRDNVTLPIRPDALFTIAPPAGQGRAHYFLEADRGTMAHSRMRGKVRAYAAYFQQQRHAKKYEGMKTFRVATITETRGRAESLADEFRSIMQPAWLAAYPVMAVEDVTLERLMPELAGPPGG